MRYYKLVSSFEKRIVGQIPQIEKILWIGKPNHANGFSEQELFGKIHGNPAVPRVELYKNAIMTDLLDIAVIPQNKFLVVSEQFFSFLKPYFEEYRSWRISVRKERDNFEYYILHVDNPESDFVNYEKSIFKLFQKDENRKIIDLKQTVNLTSDSDYLIKLREYYIKGVGIGFPYFKETKVTFNISKLSKDLIRCSFVLSQAIMCLKR